VAVTNANEVDEIAALAAAATRRTLVVARRAAEARRQAQAQTRQRATAAAAAPAAAHAGEDAALAAVWRREAIAARWAAADVLRDQDAQTAAAWDERVHAAGIDPDTVRSEATTSTGTTSTDPDAAASDVVTEHLAGVYTEEAGAATAAAERPGGLPAPAGSDASVADLIAATHCETPERGHSAAFDPTPATTADVERLEHTRDEGVER